MGLFFPVSIPMFHTLEEFVRDVMSRLPFPVWYTAILAGGALRAFYDFTPVKDYDLFFANREDFEAAVFALTTMPNSRLLEGSAEGHPSFLIGDHPIPYNLVGFEFMPDLASLAHSFDFTCVQHAAKLNMDEVEIYSAPLAIDDAMSKIIRIANYQTIDRLHKRIERYQGGYGYTAIISEAEYEICRNTTTCSRGSY